MYRVTRTIVRGQFENDKCFVVWMAANPVAVNFVKFVDDLHIGASKAELLNPSLSTDPNDHRLYMWIQTADVPLPKCANGGPDLVSFNGKTGFETQKEAQAALDHELGGTNAIAAAVGEANNAAISPQNVIPSAVKALADDAAKAADAASKGLLSSPLVWIGLFGVGAVLAIKTLK